MERDAVRLFVSFSIFFISGNRVINMDMEEARGMPFVGQISASCRQCDAWRAIIYNN
jgi:hypothetical protein